MPDSSGAVASTIQVELRHVTRYTYDSAVLLGPQTIRLQPASHTRVPILAYDLAVLPHPDTRNTFPDPSGNHLTRVSFAAPTATLEVAVTLTAAFRDINPFDFVVAPEAATWPFHYPDLLREELAPCLTPVFGHQRLASLVADATHGVTSSVDMLTGMNRLIFERIAYTTRDEPGVQDSEETLTLARGSCRDSAWLLVQLARNLGFAARFVSGYLIQLATLDGAVPEDRADLHAWAEIYLPGAGWLGFDATSGLMTGNGHIPLSCNPNPLAAAPISGTVQAGTTRFEAEMSVRRVSC